MSRGYGTPSRQTEIRFFDIPYFLYLLMIEFTICLVIKNNHNTRRTQNKNHKTC